MRDFFKLFFLMSIPALLLVIGSIYVLDQNRFRNAIERTRPAVLSERLATASKAPLNDLRSLEHAPRNIGGFAQQLQKDIAERLSTLDQIIQKGLSAALGFSPAASDLATSMMSWTLLLWMSVLLGILAFRHFAPIHLRQRLITGSNGAQARTGGSFEVPH